MSEILNLLNMADGYLQASTELANQCLLDNHNNRSDIIIFPILNNANHGIELYLKGIIWIINEITNSGYKTERGHNIKQLYTTTQSKIKEYKGQLKLREFNKETKGLSNYINELFSIIEPIKKNDKMDFSRYPFTKDFLDHFYVGDMFKRKSQFVIDLENFVSRVEIIHRSLDDLSSYLYHYELHEDDNITYAKFLENEYGESVNGL